MKTKVGKRSHYTARNVQLFLLASPVLIYLFIFAYLPMGGVIVAFKDYRYDKGIFGSAWAGFSNFEFFFKSRDAFMVTANTVAYNSVFIVLGTVVAIFVALLMNEVRSKLAIKVYQTTMFFPHFLSWVVVSFITYTFLSPTYGLLNQWVGKLGIEPTNWYFMPSIWPYFIVFVDLWKSMGMAVLINFAVLVGIDRAYYESASIDGASRWQLAWHISLPTLIPVTVILFILKVGHIFNADFGLFYQVTKNSPMLYDKTMVIDTYVFRALMEMNEIGMGAAVGFFQALVGFIIVIGTNAIVRKIRSDSALF